MSYHFSKMLFAVQNVYTTQPENSVLNLLMEMRAEIASLKNEVTDLKKEIKDMKETTKRQFVKLTEEVVTVKLEARKQHGLDMVIDELNDTHKFPFNEVKDLQAFDVLVQQNETILKQFKEFIAKTGGKGPLQFLRAAVRKIFSNNLACQYSWKGTSVKPSAEKC
ncbi:uncharacterized protein LOC131801435 [Musca domestica]|uniref:Uncharacterized protein LOC131801435 n=1 Tax=Musca domestica TaxID=7370 RepID=A0ABM3URN8_MUSDO|nr:uncharacterized protein LOC131801435 [Musca domestica]